MSRSRMGLLALPMAAALLVVAPTVAVAEDGADSSSSKTSVTLEQLAPGEYGTSEGKKKLDAVEEDLRKAMESGNEKEAEAALEKAISVLKELNAPQSVIAGLEQILGQATDSGLSGPDKQDEEAPVEGKGKAPKPQEQQEIRKEKTREKTKEAIKAISPKKGAPKKIAAGGR